MTSDHLHKILKSLSDKRPVFHSEDDFKVHLAIEMKSYYQNIGITDVYLEKPEMITMLEKDGNEKKYHAPIDLLVKINNEIVPIELKYKTKKEKINCSDNSDVFYNLKNQGAYPESLFRFRRDIFRVEKIKEKYSSSVGYVLLLTNDDYYRSSVKENTFASGYSINSTIDSTDPGWDYSSMDMTKVKKHGSDLYKYKDGKKHWTCRGDNYLKLKLEQDYDPIWRPYSKPKSTKGSDVFFSYCLIEV